MAGSSPTPRSNSLIITDTRSRIGNITDFVRGLDIRTPQLSIQAKIIFVDRTDIEQLGIKYDLGDRQPVLQQARAAHRPGRPGEPFDRNVNVVDLGGNSVVGDRQRGRDITGSALDLIFSTTHRRLHPHHVPEALRAERAGGHPGRAGHLDARQPRRRTSSSVKKPRSASSTRRSAGASGAARANVQFKETGIRLTVTPHVTNNRQILMKLRTERSAIQPLAAADLGFIFQKQKADNQLLVNDGETAVIGGLTVTEVTKTRSGIPLLSGLPIVGKLFSFSKRRGEPPRPDYLGHAADHRRRRSRSSRRRGPARQREALRRQAGLSFRRSVFVP